MDLQKIDDLGVKSLKNWKFRGMWICKKIGDLGIKVLRGESLEGYGFAKKLMI